MALVTVPGLSDAAGLGRTASFRLVTVPLKIGAVWPGAIAPGPSAACVSPLACVPSPFPWSCCPLFRCRCRAGLSSLGPGRYRSIPRILWSQPGAAGPSRVSRLSCGSRRVRRVGRRKWWKDGTKGRRGNNGRVRPRMGGSLGGGTNTWCRDGGHQRFIPTVPDDRRRIPRKSTWSFATMQTFGRFHKSDVAR
jgi:hypothetical protein